MDEGFKMLDRSIGINAQQSLPFYEILPWVLLSVGIIIVFWGVLVFLRKLALDKRRDKGVDVQRTMEQIEKFHKDGILSDEEYKRALRAILGKNELISGGEQGSVLESRNDDDDNS